MTKKKITKPTTKVIKPAKKAVRWQDEYLCMWSFKLKPVCDEYLEHIGQEFVSWCRQSRVLEPSERNRFSLERFLEDKGIPYDTMEIWRKRNTILRESINAGKIILGNMLEEGLLTKRYSEKGTSFVLHNYLPRYKKDNKYHTELKNTKDAVAQLLGIKFDVPDLDDDRE